MKIKKSVWITLATILVLLIGVGIYLTNLQYNNFDFTVLSFVRKSIYPGMFFKTITKLGNTSSYFIILIPVSIYLIYKKNYKLLVSIFCSVILASIFMGIFKNIFQRERPYEFFVYQQGGYSYPSGHASVSSAFYWTLAYILQINKKSKILIGICVLIPILIGFSRLVLGVHWPTDVLMGFLLGFSISLVSREIYLNFGETKND